ncbi:MULTISPECIES: MarR family winged helix-turn-helix transcriptional regulator [Bacillaceae]|uniref:MarR family transcriptional regulator n=1 Tax=Evansella alkalicola TaxID=745819 RepID=A0ABS6JMW3_9BACI|nr:MULTISPECIES: MarR family transcriptional regulator [Bacillaceae]MBU9719901.1 MarR family transcriptional regulator [Bacillus alkalicola]
MKKRFHKLIVGTSNSHYKKSTSQFSALGLSPGQPKILETLIQLEGCMQKELAEACEVEPATITSILPGMEKKDLIKRETIVNGPGKRALSVRLTEKGKAMEREVARVFQEVEELSFKGFTDVEKETFLSLLERVHTNMKET